MKRKAPKLAAALLAAAVMVAFAQPGKRGPRGATDGTPPADAAITYLGITETQLDSFEAIRQNARTAAEPIQEQIRTKMEALRQARQNSDATAIANLQVEIDALQAQVQKIREDARVQIVGSLTADQKAKLANLTAAANLMDEVRQASALGLLTPPEGAGPGGPGFGKGFGKGRGGPKGAF